LRRSSRHPETSIASLRSRSYFFFAFFFFVVFFAAFAFFAFFAMLPS
jgi:hypothetical protein